MANEHPSFYNNTEADLEPTLPKFEKNQRILQQTILDVSKEIQSPRALIISSMLSTLSLACQPNRVVVHPSGQVSPLSLYLFTLAVSGERKTATDQALMKSVVEFQKQMDLTHAAALAENTAQMHAWTHRLKFLDRQITKAWSQDRDADALISERDAHRKLQPSAPKGIKLQIENATAAGFVGFFDKYYPATSIIADEGASALTTFASSNLGNLNKSWNGKTLDIQRKKASESLTILNPRLTVHLMLQPEIFNSTLEKNNNFWQESGLLARALFAAPKTKIGSRILTRPLISVSNGLSTFHERVTKLLQSGYVTPHDKVESIYFSGAASKQWTDYLLSTKQQMQPGGKYSGILGAASKAAENVARIAAILQCFEYYLARTMPPISAENTEVAIELVEWYLSQQIEFFTYRIPPEQEREADLLWRWVWTKAEHVPYYPNRMYAVRLIAKNASPRVLRKAAVWHRALDLLEQREFISFTDVNGEEMIIVNPSAPAPLNYGWRV